MGDAAQETAFTQFTEAVAEDLDLLHRLHSGELNEDAIASLRESEFPNHLGLVLSEKGQEVADDLAKVVAGWPVVPDQELIERLSTDYSSIYLIGALRASPNESVWVDEEGLTHQVPMFQVREWYAKHDLKVPDWRVLPDDHLVNELIFVQRLMQVAGSNQEVLAETAQFMDEHLLRWLTPFAERVAQRCDTDFYAGFCLLTSFYCEHLRDLLAEILGESRPTKEEIDARMDALKPPQEQEMCSASGNEPPGI